MKEPSVLDYLKSRLPWSKNKLDYPTLETGSQGDEQPPAVTSLERPGEPAVREQQKLPWRTFLALALALFAQFTLDPVPFSSGNTASNSLRITNSQQALYIGLFFYILAGLFLIWAYFIKEFSLPSLPEDQPETDPQTAGRRWIIAALVLAFITFLIFGPDPFNFIVSPDNHPPVFPFFSENLFTPLNVTFWLAGLALFMRGLWLHRTQQLVVSAEGEETTPKAPQPFSSPGVITKWWDAILLLILAFNGALGFGGNIYLFGLLPLLVALAIIWLRDPNSSVTPAQHIRAFFAHDSWQINLTRWTLLILAVSALVIFFRFYRLDGVPAEPFSDHAEKLLDVYDITQGHTHVFFERNTGREFIQFYWTALLAYLLNTGLTFISLKIGTALIGLLTLPYIYLLGKELGGKRVALFALILAGVAYWPNTISRIGLRFPLYPAFAAPVLYYLIRGLRTQKRNDFILAGLFLGLGLNGYSPFRFVPFVVVAAVGLYILHKPSEGKRKQVLMMLAILVVTSFLVFLPLFRYAIEHPNMISERALTRLTDAEHPLPTPAWCPLPGNTGAGVCIFLSNTLNAMTMFQWDDGDTWVHSVTHRPALDIVAAVLFTFGYLLVLVRYLRQRRWQDIFLIVSVPLLLMPSILSLAFPSENPSLNRTGGALVVVFIVAAMALDGLYTAFGGGRSRSMLPKFALGAVIFLLGMSAIQSYDLVFNQFDKQFRAAAWNSSDMGRIIRGFIAEGNPPDNAWVVPFPYWVDTRITGIQSGLPTKDQAINRDQLAETVSIQGAKLFIFKKGDAPDNSDSDVETLNVLRQLYPNGLLGVFDAPLEGKDFWIYTVPDSQTVTP